MLSFGIYETEELNILEIKNCIKNYAEEQYAAIKQYVINNITDLIKLKPKICLIDYKTYLSNLEILKEWKSVNKINFICIVEDYIQMIDAVKSDSNNLYLLKPIKLEVLILLLDYARQKIKSNVISIHLGHNEEEIIEVKNLNYVNIVNRSLRFHMTCNREIDSQSLRQSFVKEAEPMLRHPELYFMPPSLIVNLENIKQLYDDHITFKNGNVIYYPRTAYEKLKTAWKTHHDILD